MTPLERSVAGVGLVQQDICLYHGGRIVGDVDIRTKAKSMAYGPGLYLTTSYWTARKYRGGNGFVYRICIDGGLRWAHQVRLNGPQIDLFLASIPKLKWRREVGNDMRRLRARRPDDTVSMVAVMNTLDIHQSYGASVAQNVLKALVTFGVDATLVTGANSGNEDWVALHNAAAIRSITKLDGPEPDAPRIKEE
jgi:hypothetical protein